MLTFNKLYLIKNDYIFHKKTGKFYRLPEPLVQQLSLYKKDLNLRKLEKNFLNFLLKEQILTESDVLYNPFVTHSERYNNIRFFIQLTGKCNLSCKHCFLGGSSVVDNYFTYGKIVKLIDTAVDLGITKIDFTGGEISTISYLDKLISYLDTKPIIYRFFTNLAFTPNNLLKKFVECKGLQEIITSIDYFRADKHDEFRGKSGAFNSTFKNVLYLNENHISITINTMILQDNHEDIKEMIDFFLPRKINIHFDTITNKGNAKKILNYLAKI